MLFLQLSIGAENMPEDLRRMSDRINDVSSESVEKENWKYRINFTTNYVPISVNADKQTVMDILDGFLKQVFAYEEDLFTKLR